MSTREDLHQLAVARTHLWSGLKELFNDHALEGDLQWSVGPAGNFAVGITYDEEPVTNITEEQLRFLSNSQLYASIKDDVVDFIQSFKRLRAERGGVVERIEKHLGSVGYPFGSTWPPRVIKMMRMPPAVLQVIESKVLTETDPLRAVGAVVDGVTQFDAQERELTYPPDPQKASLSFDHVL